MCSVRGNQLSSEMENLEAMQEFEPRPYQIYLYEKAVEENSIIFLPTGTGKTFIAVLLIKRLCRTIQKLPSPLLLQVVFFNHCL